MAIFIVAITIAFSALLGGNPMVATLEKQIGNSLTALGKKYSGSKYKNATKVIGLVRQLIHLDKDQVSVERMVRFLQFCCVSGCIVGAVGLLLLVLNYYLGWSESWVQLTTTVLAFISIISIVACLFVVLSIGKAYRQAKK